MSVVSIQLEAAVTWCTVPSFWSNTTWTNRPFECCWILQMYFINGSNVIDKARSFPNQLHIDTTSPALFQPVKSHFLKIFDKIHRSMRCLQLRVTVTLGMRCCEEAARGLERSKGGRPSGTHTLHCNTKRQTKTAQNFEFHNKN